MKILKNYNFKNFEFEDDVKVGYDTYTVIGFDIEKDKFYLLKNNHDSEISIKESKLDDNVIIKKGYEYCKNWIVEDIGNCKLVTYTIKLDDYWSKSERCFGGGTHSVPERKDLNVVFSKNRIVEMYLDYDYNWEYKPETDKKLIKKEIKNDRCIEYPYNSWGSNSKDIIRMFLDILIKEKIPTTYKIFYHIQSCDIIRDDIDYIKYRDIHGIDELYNFKDIDTDFKIRNELNFTSFNFIITNKDTIKKYIDSNTITKTYVENAVELTYKPNYSNELNTTEFKEIVSLLNISPKGKYIDYTFKNDINTYEFSEEDLYFFYDKLNRETAIKYLDDIVKINKPIVIDLTLEELLKFKTIPYELLNKNSKNIIYDNFTKFINKVDIKNILTGVFLSYYNEISTQQNKECIGLLGLNYGEIIKSLLEDYKNYREGNENLYEKYNNLIKNKNKVYESRIKDSNIYCKVIYGRNWGELSSNRSDVTYSDSVELLLEALPIESLIDNDDVEGTLNLTYDQAESVLSKIYGRDSEWGISYLCECELDWDELVNQLVETEFNKEYIEKLLKMDIDEYLGRSI